MDKRKWKKGGKAKEEIANLNLEVHQTACQLNLHEDQHQTILHDVVSKIKKVKVKGDQKEANVSEVD